MAHCDTESIASKVLKFLPEIGDLDWSPYIDDAITSINNGGIYENRKSANFYASIAIKDPALIAYYAIFPLIGRGFFKGADGYRAERYFSRLRELTNERERTIMLQAMFATNGQTP